MQVSKFILAACSQSPFQANLKHYNFLSVRGKHTNTDCPYREHLANWGQTLVSFLKPARICYCKMMAADRMTNSAQAEYK